MEWPVGITLSRRLSSDIKPTDTLAGLPDAAAALASASATPSSSSLWKRL